MLRTCSESYCPLLQIFAMILFLDLKRVFFSYSLTNLFMEEMLEADYLHLLQTCELAFNRLSISLEQIHQLEAEIRGPH